MQRKQLYQFSFYHNLIYHKKMSKARLRPMQLFNMSGKVCIVTGASSGLGERFVRVLHAVNASVVCCARRLDRLQQLQKELGTSRVFVVKCDVAIKEDRDHLIQQTLERFQRIDVLINNAGVSLDDGQPATKLNSETFLKVMNINVNALFFLSQEVGNIMLKQKKHDPNSNDGVIVNNASVHAFGASAPNYNLSYSTSKAAVVNMSRELAIQWATRGVRVNCLAPGYFPSEIHTSEAMPKNMTLENGTVLDEKGELNPYSKHIMSNISMKRLGKADELDGALLFLCSNASSYATGMVLQVDGGWTHY